MVQPGQGFLPSKEYTKFLDIGKELLHKPGMSDTIRVNAGIVLLRSIAQDELPGKGELPCPLEHSKTLEVWRAMYDPLQRLARLAESRHIDSTLLLNLYCSRYIADLDAISPMLDRLEVIEELVASETNTGTPGSAGSVKASGIAPPTQPPPPDPPVSDAAFLSETDLAATFGVSQDTLRSRLRVWRKHHMNNDWIRTPNPRPRDPKFLYRVGSVRSILEELKATGEPPAKKKRPKKTR